jgi:hypothetical protein
MGSLPRSNADLGQPDQIPAVNYGYYGYHRYKQEAENKERGLGPIEDGLGSSALHRRPPGPRGKHHFAHFPKGELSRRYLLYRSSMIYARK